MKDQKRNLNPTPEAKIAMWLWSKEYAHEQKGGSMDFWDSLSESRKRMCRKVLSGVAKAMKAHGVSIEDAISKDNP